MKAQLHFILCFLFCSSLQAQNFNKIIKQTASDRDANDRLGMAADISGGFAIVGASLEDHDANDGDSLAQAGAAYIFGRGLGGNWTEVAKLVPNDRASNDRFGFSVAIDGERAVVGATNKAIGSNNGQGAAYVFERQSNGSWVQVQKLFDPLGEALDNFGNAVTLQGDVILVGAAFSDPDDIRDAGKVFVFERDTVGNWPLIQTLSAIDKDIGDSFGSAVTLDSNRLAVGAWFAHNNRASTNNDADAGAVYTYLKNPSSGQWVHTQIVLPDTNDWVGGDLFGGTLDLEGDVLVVGADGDDVDENQQNILNGSGAVHIFLRDPVNGFQEIQKLVASDREENASFGQKVAIAGDKILVGAPGESEKVGENDPNGLSFAGAAYLFEKNAQDVYEEVQRIVPFDREEFDSFGFALGMTSNYLLITANQDDENETDMDSLINAGSIYFFEECSLDNTVSESNGTLTANLANANYQWVDCSQGNLSIPGEAGQSFMPDSSGFYAVEIIDKGCFVTSECANLIVLSVGEKIDPLPFVLFPNPATTTLTLETQISTAKLRLEIFQMGQMLASASNFGSSLSIELSELPVGIYLAKVLIGENVYWKKIVLVK